MPNFKSEKTNRRHTLSIIQQQLGVVTPQLIYLYGEKMIDELWPPNPNELDNAALTSSLSFFGPTSTFVS